MHLIHRRSRQAPRAAVAKSAAVLRAPLVVLALAFYVASANNASAQFHRHTRADGSVFFSRLPQVQQDTRWRGVIFPARTARTYRRAPQELGLDQRRAQFEPYFAEASTRYGLPIDFLRAVAHVESQFDPNAVSVDGAAGLMQLMPFTSKKMGVTDPHDPHQNILGGARFLRILANQWAGDIVLTVAAYNAGSGAVKRYGGIPPFAETQRYVRRVLNRYNEYVRERGPRAPAVRVSSTH
jgi:soluble lytic murein transglycosylase-like protein